MSKAKYVLLIVNGAHEIHECRLEDIDSTVERFCSEGKDVLDIFDSRECAEHASRQDMYRTGLEPR